MGKVPKFYFPDGQRSQIMYGDNLISDKSCRGLIAECKTYFDRLFQPGITLGGINSLVKSSSDFNFSKSYVDSQGVDSSNFSFYENEVTDGLYKAIGYYIQQYEELWKWPGVRDTGYRLQRYFKSHGYYRTHIDGAPWDTTGGPGPRVLGVVIYLNDVEVGGSTYFPAHDVHVPAKAGRISVFPTNWTHPHMGQTPISCDKWMISTFMVCDVYERPEPQEPPTYSEQTNETLAADG